MSFLSFAEERGLIVDHIIEGRWVRVPTTDHPHKRNGAYFYAGDYAHIQNWAIMDKAETWIDKKPRTPFEQSELSKRMEDSRRKHAKQREKLQKVAAKKAEWILSRCELDRHGYLEKKGFADLKGNIWKREGQDPLLVVPMYCNDLICGCQLIGSTGEKRFIFGARTSLAEFVIGSAGLDIWCEGYATGIAISKAVAALKVAARIHITFSAGNLLKLAKTGIVIADNDVSLTGEEYAKKTGLPYFLPDTVGWDFCDLYQAKGLFKSSQELRKFLMSVK